MLSPLGSGLCFPHPSELRPSPLQPACLCVRGCRGGVRWWFALQGRRAREGHRGKVPAMCPGYGVVTCRGAVPHAAPRRAGMQQGSASPGSPDWCFGVSTHPTPKTSCCLVLSPSASALQPVECWDVHLMSHPPLGSTPWHICPSTEQGVYLQQIFFLEICGFGGDDKLCKV